MQTCLPLPQRSEGAAIVDTASIFGVVGAPGYAAYCTSQAALVALTEVAALELAPEGIRAEPSFRAASAPR